MRRTPSLQISSIYAYRNSLYTGASQIQVALVSIQQQARSAQGSNTQLSAEKIDALQRVFNNYTTVLAPLNATADTVRELDEGSDGYRDVQDTLSNLASIFGQVSTFILSDLNNLYDATYSLLTALKAQGNLQAAAALDILDEATTKQQSKIQGTKKGKQDSFNAGAQNNTDLNTQIQKLQSENQLLRSALADAQRTNVDAGIAATPGVSTPTAPATTSGRRATTRG